MHSMTLNDSIAVDLNYYASPYSSTCVYIVIFWTFFFFFSWLTIHIILWHTNLILAVWAPILHHADNQNKKSESPKVYLLTTNCNFGLSSKV